MIIPMRSLVVYALMLFSARSVGQFWDQRADFPSTAYSGYGFSIGERVYAGGGIGSLSPFAMYSGFQEYLPGSDTWVQRAPLPGPERYGTSGFSVNGKGYVLAGWGTSALTDVWEYDPIADSWTQKSSFPGAARYTHVSVGVGNKAYVGLGYNPWMNDWWEFDPIADTWTQRAPLPGAGRQSCGAFVIDGNVYVTVGASDVNNITATLHTELYRYTPANDTWTLRSPFPALGRAIPYCFSFDGVGYVIGGSTGDANGHSVLNDAWAYSPLSNGWYQLGLFPGIPMYGGFACTTSLNAYIGTGSTAISNSSWGATSLTPAFWEYSPSGLVGITELTAENDLLVQPMGDGLLVRWDATRDARTLRLFDGTGRLVREQAVQASHGQAFCATGNLGTGAYVVHLVGAKESRHRKVVVVN